MPQPSDKILNDPEAMLAIETLRSRGYTPEQAARAMEYAIDPMKATRRRARLDCCRCEGHPGAWSEM